MINFSNVTSVTIPEGAVTKIVAAGKTLWELIVDTYKNWVQHSTTNDGKTIYNSTGYKNGVRIRSGGAEGSQSNAAATGFIPVKGGDIVRLSGWDFSVKSAANCLNVSDSSFTNTGQFTMQPAHSGILSGGTYGSYDYSSVVKESANVWKWVVPPAASGVAYIRVTAYDASTSAPGANMIVTVNEEIN